MIRRACAVIAAAMLFDSRACTSCTTGGTACSSWLWMSERKVDALEALLHEEAVSVHMEHPWRRANRASLRCVP